ncbi:MAG: FG-GAP-like repeat-containing protein [Alphaproteobacteria bacterium]|nr:FG-GAP-like repeat-containing protein [Alphaproteobacteria bacterium]
MIQIKILASGSTDLTILKHSICCAAVAILVYASPACAQLMTTPGKIDVNASGAATYSVPVSVPPGTAGMIPSIALRYSSQGGDGALGLGWSIGGLSEIDRCGRTIAQDGVNGGVNFDSNDRFCLDGQRLVAVSGAYGADGTEYRTEKESFSKIISHGAAGSGPAWWEVKTKSGQRMEYGNTTDSTAILSGSSSIKAWLVSKISDTKGNYLAFAYAQSFTYNGVATGEALISTISYTGNSATGLAPKNKVEFIYATRPDVTPVYFFGAQSYRSQRLTNVKTWTGQTLVSDYRLTYEQNGLNRSRIASVAQCDGSGQCLPSTSFGWTGTSSDDGKFMQVSSTIANNVGAPPSSWWKYNAGEIDVNGKADIFFLGETSIWTYISKGDGTFKETGIEFPSGGPVALSKGGLRTNRIPGDFNGDGRTDAVYFAGNSAYTFLTKADGTYTFIGSTLVNNYGSPPDSKWAIVSGDFNGDGKTDIAFWSGTSIWTYRSKGDGTFTETSSTITIGALSAPPSTNWASFSGDLNGDGKYDVAFASGNSIYAFLSKGDGTFTQVKSTVANNNSSPPTKNWQPVSGDFDGDGLLDLGFFGGTSIRTYRSKGDGTFKETGQTFTGTSLGSPPNLWASTPGDFNSDGLTDVSFIKGKVNQTFLSTGDGTFRVVSTTNGNTLSSPYAQSWLPFSGDFNGDGRTDIGFIGGSSLWTYLSKGDGNFKETGTTFTGGNLSVPPSTSWVSLNGDFNGDGKSDISFFSNRTLYVFLGKSGGPELVTSINAPAFNSTTSLSYLPLTISSVYTKLTGATYPDFDYQGSIYVLGSMMSPNGIGGTYKSTYTYTGAKLNALRGFLGFASQSVKDEQTGVIQTTNFLQAYPYTGLISSQTKALGSLTLNNTANTYTLGTLPWTGTKFPVLTKKVISSKDLDGTALPTTTTTYEYDSYGNTTKIVNSTPEGSSQTTTSTYSNDSTNWFLGRLTSSSATNTTP